MGRLRLIGSPVAEPFLLRDSPMQTRTTAVTAIMRAALIWGTTISTAVASDWQWIKIADSEAEFSGQQGSSGWYYLYATSDEDTGVFMSVFDDKCPPPLQWNPAWRSQCGSYCFISRSATHTNLGVMCDTPSAGLQIPIRRYSPPASGLYRVTVEFIDDPISFSNSDGVRVSLVADEQVLWEAESNGTAALDATGSVDVLLDPDRGVDVRSHPKTGCHHDTHLIFIEIDALDCNGDGIVDFQQIESGTFPDTDGNGVLDICECIADLNDDAAVNGADIAVVLGFWGLTGEAVLGDINRDGTVNGADLAILLGSWGECPQ